MFHYLSGQYDGWISECGDEYSKLVKRARAAGWAWTLHRVICDAQMRVTKTECISRIAEESWWSTLPTARQREYLIGKRSPISRQRESAELLIPESRTVYEHSIWRALLPKTDLRDCELLFGRLGGSPSLDRIYTHLATGTGCEIAEELRSLDPCALFILNLRIAKSGRDQVRVQLAADGILQSACFLALRPALGLSAINLWEAIVNGPLFGPSKEIEMREVAIRAFADFTALMTSAIDETWRKCGGFYR